MMKQEIGPYMFMLWKKLTFKLSNGNCFFFWIALSVAYLLYHLLTLEISPIVWYDEVCLASEVHSYTTTGRIMLEASPHFFKGEVRHYGPIFFMISSLFIKLLGFGIIQYRLVMLTFGLTSVILTYFVCYKVSNSRLISLLSMVTLMFDKTFISSCHNGRMETMVLSFALLCFYFLLGNKKIYSIFLSGVFAGLAILTTPRIGFLILPIGIYWCFKIFQGFKLVQFKYALVWASPILGLYAIWFFYSFGSVENLLSVYSHINSKGSFLGSSFRINMIQIPLFVLFVFLLVMGLIKRKLNFEFSWLFGGAVVFFYILVNDVGPYSVLILPFYYIAIANWAKNLKVGNLGRYLMPGLLVFNLLIFSFKLGVLLISSSNRNHSQLVLNVKSLIPPGSIVVGDARYFYSVIISNSSFRYNEEDFSDKEFERLYRTKDDYDYLIVANERLRKKPSFFRVYSKNSKLVEVGKISSGSSEDKLSKVVKTFLSNRSVNTGYEGIVYRRIKTKPEMDG